MPFGRTIQVSCGCSFAWQSRAAPAQFWASVAWSPTLNLFAATSLDGGANQVMTSPDGITWTLRATPIVRQWTIVRWIPTINAFVAMSQDGGLNVSRSMLSTDGINWTAGAIATGQPAFQDISYSTSLGTIVGVASGNPTNNTNVAYTSPNGVNWTARVLPAGTQLRGIARHQAAGQFIALDAVTQDCYTSPNGIAWTLQPLAAFARQAIAYSPTLGLAVSVPISVSGAGAFSTLDASLFTARSAPVANSWARMIWIQQRGVFMCIGSSAALVNVMTSSDGINWIGSTGAANSVWNDLAYSPTLNRVVAVSGSAAARVMTNG